MSENKEIEVRVKIENSENLLNFLKEKATFTGEKHQIDKYFTPAHRNFLGIKPASEWLRLRDSSGKYFITYKNWHYEADGKSHFCDEYETKVDSLGQLEKIFGVLNMKEVVVVDKVRRTYIYQDFEIAIDSVKNLGDRVEIEYKGKTEGLEPAKVASKMIDFLKEIGCGKIRRDYAGYPFQLLFPKEIVFEEL